MAMSDGYVRHYQHFIKAYHQNISYICFAIIQRTFTTNSRRSLTFSAHNFVLKGQTDAATRYNKKGQHLRAYLRSWMKKRCLYSCSTTHSRKQRRRFLRKGIPLLYANLWVPLGVLRIRISDPRWLGSWCIKGTDESGDLGGFVGSFDVHYPSDAREKGHNETQPLNKNVLICQFCFFVTWRDCHSEVGRLEEKILAFAERKMPNKFRHTLKLF